MIPPNIHTYLAITHLLTSIHPILRIKLAHIHTHTHTRTHTLSLSVFGGDRGFPHLSLLPWKFCCEKRTPTRLIYRLRALVLLVLLSALLFPTTINSPHEAHGSCSFRCRRSQFTYGMVIAWARQSCSLGKGDRIATLTKMKRDGEWRGLKSSYLIFPTQT